MKKLAAFYQPDRGDFVWLDFTPHAGIEQAGRRPALVLSPRDFNIATGLAVVCPVTNQGKGSSFEVPVPRGAGVTGFILSDQLRSLDWIVRKAERISAADEATMWEVIGRVEAILRVSVTSSSRHAHRPLRSFSPFATPRS